MKNPSLAQLIELFSHDRGKEIALSINSFVKTNKAFKSDISWILIHDKSEHRYMECHFYQRGGNGHMLFIGNNNDGMIELKANVSVASRESDVTVSSIYYCIHGDGGQRYYGWLPHELIKNGFKDISVAGLNCLQRPEYREQ